MRGIAARLLSLAVIFALIGPLLGCGGGGGSEPPPPPPPIEIGPGPGLAATEIGAEPGISTLAARTAPLATAPRANLVQEEAISRLEGLAGNPPQTQAQLAALLADFTGWVTQQPNDAVSQVGLALVTVVTGAYNAGIQAGYSSGDLLALSEPAMEIASAGGADPSHLARQIIALCVPSATPWPGIAPAQTGFDPSAPDFSSADLQIAIRALWLPVINSAIDRLKSVADNAGGPDVPLVEIGGRHPWTGYRAEVNALAGLLRVLKGALMTACSWQFNPGSWDWTVGLAQRDANHDGRLSVGEYLPPDPFLWRHDSSNMRNAGAAIRTGLDAFAGAVDARRPDSLLARWANGAGSADLIQMARDLQTTMSSIVNVTFRYGAGGPTSSRVVPMDLGRAWNDPVDDAKDLFPVLRLVSGNPAWDALPTAGDFPDPTLGGVFPQPTALISMIASGPSYVEVSYGAVDLVLVDRR